MFYTRVDDFFNWLFKDLNGKFDFRTLVILLIGILLGIVITSLTYGIILLSNIKQTKKKSPTIDVSDEVLLKEVNVIKKEFSDLTLTFTPTDKFKVLGTMIVKTVKKIAGIYYPNSKHPLFELNISELLVLINYISNRIDSIFDKKILRPFKTMSISQVLNILDYYKKLQENKIVKTVKKTGPVRKIVLTILNYANPVYWFKKILLSGTVSIAITKICLIVIDIVADETIKVYSKRLFNEEKNIMYNEIKKELKEMEDLQ